MPKRQNLLCRTSSRTVTRYALVFMDPSPLGTQTGSQYSSKLFVPLFFPWVTSIMDNHIHYQKVFLRGEEWVKRMPLRWWERSSRWRWGRPIRSRRWRRCEPVSPSGRYFRSPWWTVKEKKNYFINCTCIFLICLWS